LVAYSVSRLRCMVGQLITPPCSPPPPALAPTLQGGDYNLVTSVLDLVLGEWMLPAHERRAYWIPYGELPPPPKGSPTAGAVPLPSSAVEGAAEWVMARDKNGRLAWHIAAEQVRGVFILGGGLVYVCVSVILWHWDGLGLASWRRQQSAAPRPVRCRCRAVQQNG
jgi:hypothetical protein